MLAEPIACLKYIAGMELDNYNVFVNRVDYYMYYHYDYAIEWGVNVKYSTLYIMQTRSPCIYTVGQKCTILFLQ